MIEILSGHLVLLKRCCTFLGLDPELNLMIVITFFLILASFVTLIFLNYSREMFDKWQAQRWWGENYDRIMELYNVQRFNCHALDTPSRSEDGVIIYFTPFL